MSKKQGKSNTENTGSLTPVNETGRRLIALRTARNLSQKEVAAAIGVNYTSYSAWEIGEYKKNGGRKRQPVELKGKHIVALADWFGVSCDYILCRSEYTAIDGAAIGARTGLTDEAIQLLEASAGVQYITAAGDVSRLLMDYKQHGENSVLSTLHKYAQTLPDTVLTLNTNTGRPAAGLYGSDIPLSGALLYLTVVALDQYKKDLQTDNAVSK